MSKIVRLSGPSRSREEAAAWLARIDRGLADEERGELERWLAARPRNREVFLELAELWDELDVLGELAELFPLDRAGSRMRFRSRRLAWSTAAFTAIAALGLAWLQLELHRQRDDATLAAHSVRETFETPVGGHASERLPDGSVVTLNTNTEIRVVFTPAARDLFLIRGEANFEVAHDSDHPFKVHVGERVVRAVGTAFDVQLHSDGDVEVTVTEGTVTIGLRRTPDSTSPSTSASPSMSTATSASTSRSTLSGLNQNGPSEEESADVPAKTLAAGEAVRLAASDSPEDDTSKIVQLKPIDLDIKLAWQRGMLIFRGEPLEAVLEEVGRYTTVDFVLADDDLRAVRVGGYFRAGDIDGLLVALRENFKIESDVADGGRIVLRQGR